jgi:predicted dehydrogenase
VTFVECTFNVRGLTSGGFRSALMSIGCYPIQAALIAFNHEEPKSIVATGFKGEFQGKLTDRMVIIILKYSNNRLAVLNCLGEDIESINSLKIHGTKGKMKMILFISLGNFRCN